MQEPNCPFRKECKRGLPLEVVRFMDTKQDDIIAVIQGMAKVRTRFAFAITGSLVSALQPACVLVVTEWYVQAKLLWCAHKSLTR